MTILISHCDLDGFGVNVIQTLFKEYIKFDDVLNKNYGFEETQEILDLIIPDNEIIITDLSVPENIYLDWKSKLKSLIIIDHHESSKYLNNYKDNVWSTEMSGTMLFWEYYVKPILINNNVKWSNKVEHFVKLVDCYDRWQDSSDLWTDATRLNKINQSYGYSFVSHMINKLNLEWEWNEEETNYYKEIEEVEDLLVANCEKDLVIKTDNNGYNFALVEIAEKAKVSMVCSKLLTKHKDLDYCIAYYATRHSLSFRTKRQDLDLTQLQGVFGHKAAAGGQFTMPDFYKLLLEDYCISWIEPGNRKAQKIMIERITN